MLLMVVMYILDDMTLRWGQDINDGVEIYVKILDLNRGGGDSGGDYGSGGVFGNNMEDVTSCMDSDTDESVGCGKKIEINAKIEIGSWVA